MKTATEELSILPEAGAIGGCASAGCGYACCQFDRGNFIALYPGELEGAIASGQSVAHLRTVPTAHGGHHAVCQAKRPVDCDKGYKPLDCRSYPFFPTIDGQGVVAAGLKGEKCPLSIGSIAGHRAWVIQQWIGLLSRTPRLADWLRKTRLVGYRPIE